MKFLAKRRFNYFDTVGIALWTDVLKQNWFVTVPIILFLLVLSLYLENKE